MTGTVFDIKECSVHDGPGIRTTVFLKGCPLRCVWCHNPEGLEKQPQLMVKENKCVHCGLCRKECGHSECKPFGRCVHVCSNNCLEISGREYAPSELAQILLRNRDFFESSGGGITFSGGEPLFQPEFLCETLDLLDVPTAVETCGQADNDVFKRVIGKLDFVIMDVKIVDREMHKKYTGIHNDLILKNLETLINSGRKYLIRTPLIPNITDTEENLSAIQKLIGTSPWEKLPYNKLAGLKYEMLGRKYPLEALNTEE